MMAVMTTSTRQRAAAAAPPPAGRPAGPGRSGRSPRSSGSRTGRAALRGPRSSPPSARHHAGVPPARPRRLNLILRGKRLGFPLEEIRTIIDLYDRLRASQLEYVLGQIDERRTDLEQRRRDLEDALNRARRVRALPRGPRRPGRRRPPASAGSARSTAMSAALPRLSTRILETAPPATARSMASPCGRKRLSMPHRSRH